MLIVDPIDGTRPALAGFEAACTSVALAPLGDGAPTMGDVVAGCVVEIKSGEWFVARARRGLRASRPIALSENTDIERLFWVYGFTRRPAAPGGRGARRADRPLLARRRRLRPRLGHLRPDAVLTGQLDAYVEPGAADGRRGTRDARGVRARRRRLDRQQLALRPRGRGAVRVRGRRASSPMPPADRSTTVPLLGSDPELPDVVRRGRLVRAARDASRRRGTGHGTAACVGYRGPASTLTRKVWTCSSPSRVANKSLADYTHIVGRPLVEEIRELAEPLKGKRVVHLSARPRSAAASSEILYTLIPLMRDVGLEVEWQVIYGREEFFNSTKLMHNALQGAPAGPHRGAVGDLVPVQRDERARALARLGRLPRPRPAARRDAARWRPRRRRRGCGAATSTSRRRTRPRWSGCCPYLQHYPASLFHVDDYVPDGDGRRRAHRAAGDRPARAEEHGALARGRDASSASSSGSTRAAR